MRRSAIIIGMVMLLLGTVPIANAIPLYYTFDGVVTHDTIDHGYLAGDHGGPHFGTVPLDEQLYLGDSVHHTVLLDFDLSSIPDLNDPPEPTEHWFSVQYIGGTAMVNPNLYSTGGYNVFNAGGDYVPGSLFSGPTGCGIGDSIFGIYSNQLTVYDWMVGTIVYENSYYGALGGTMRETLVVTGISSSPVPEPSTILLIGTGLVGFAVPRIRRKPKK